MVDANFVRDYISLKEYPHKDGPRIKRTALKNGVWLDRAGKRQEYVWLLVYLPSYVRVGSFLACNDLMRVYRPDLPSEPARRIKRYFGQTACDHAEKLSQSLSRSKATLLELGLCNDWEIFVTLTINPKWRDRYDLSAYKKALGKFLNHYKQRVAEIQYVLVPEFHKDGAVHMHGFFRGIPSDELCINRYGYLDWPAYSSRFGYFSGGRIKDLDGAARYICKYITKDLSKLPKGSKVIMASKGLNRATVHYKGAGGDMYDFAPDYENEYVRVRWDNCDGDFLEIPMHENVWMEVSEYATL